MVDPPRVTMQDRACDLAKDRLDGQVISNIASALCDLAEEVAFQPTVQDHVEAIILFHHPV